jgi:Ala-tRNA(Pro) deacylase
MNILEYLKDLKIDYQLVEHEAVYTSEEANFIKNKLEGIGVKNLFLKDTKNNYYLILREDTKNIDLKTLASIIGSTRLSFCNETELKEILNLTKGSVTPLGIINDKENKVTIIIDELLKNQKLLVHPLINTKTISINYEDLIKFIKKENHKYLITLL